MSNYLRPPLIPFYLIKKNILTHIGDAKDAKNQKGVFTDLLYTNSNNNVCIVELKTPKTTLVQEDEYRGIKRIHPDLIGSILQAKRQKSTLMKY